MIMIRIMYISPPTHLLLDFSYCIHNVHIWKAKSVKISFYYGTSILSFPHTSKVFILVSSALSENLRSIDLGSSALSENMNLNWYYPHCRKIRIYIGMYYPQWQKICIYLCILHTVGNVRAIIETGRKDVLILVSAIVGHNRS